MPIYTYRCESCGVQFDRTQKFTDNPLTQCPECGKKTLRKVYTPVGIVFKGSGFYATDHHSPSGQSWASGSKEPASEAKAEAAEAKSEAKPETKIKSEKPKESSQPAESKSSTKE
jgi:putative FmdB family regulatory protein